MKKQDVKISNPDEFNKHLQHTSPATWAILGIIIAILASFFAWASIYKVSIKLRGLANIISGEVTLQIKDSDLSKIVAGQKVYIDGKEGEILSVSNNQPKVSNFALSDGEYTYTIVLKQVKPIDFILK